MDGYHGSGYARAVISIRLNKVKNLDLFNDEGAPHEIWRLRITYNAGWDVAPALAWFEENGIATRHYDKGFVNVLWAETPDEDIATLMQLKWL